MLTLHNVQQRSKEWHKLRNGRITASMAGRLLREGLKPLLEPQKEIPDNYWMKRGRDLESDAIEVYEKVTGIDVLQVGFVTNTDYPMCGASPDGVTDCLIEVKCFNTKKHLEIDVNNIPFDVMAQVQFSMMVCELDNCDLVLYNPEINAIDAFRIIPIFKDYDIITNIEKKMYSK